MFMKKQNEKPESISLVNGIEAKVLSKIKTRRPHN
jgi:hypothetical protein